MFSKPIIFRVFNPFPKTTNFADNNFKLNDIGRTFAIMVENNLEKDKLLDTSNLFFAQCFPMTFTADAEKQGLFRERVNTLDCVMNSLLQGCFLKLLIAIFFS